MTINAERLGEELALQPYQPRPGDTVRVIGRQETYGVVDVTDPALVTLVSAQGKHFRVGYKALEKVEDAA